MAEVKKRCDVIDPVWCRLPGGDEEWMLLSEAADLDEPEGRVTIVVSAKLLDMLVERMA
jgi:hypothetical protein